MGQALSWHHLLTHSSVRLTAGATVTFTYTFAHSKVCPAPGSALPLVHTLIETCTYTQIHTHRSICARAHTHYKKHAYTYAHTLRSTRVHTCSDARMHTYAQKHACTHTLRSTHAHVCSDACTHIRSEARTHTCTQKLARAHTLRCTHVHVCSEAHTHTYPQMHARTHMPKKHAYILTIACTQALTDTQNHHLLTQGHTICTDPLFLPPNTLSTLSHMCT